MTSSKLSNCHILDLHEIQMFSGCITSLNKDFNSPFTIKRVFYIYDIPSGADRGAHAHKQCHQLLVALTGSFEVEVFDGINSCLFTLDQPNRGLHIPPGIWASEINFSGGAICLVLASMEYEENDYIRDIDTYKRLKNGVHL
jgi:hypothetical protein